MKKFLLIFLFLSAVNSASAVGVGVKPAKIFLDGEAGKTMEAKLLIINPGGEPYLYNVSAGNFKDKIKISPSEFRLEPGGGQEVVLSARLWLPREFNADISIMNRGLNYADLPIGSGVKVPLKILVYWKNLYIFSTVVLLLVLLAAALLILSKQKKINKRHILFLALAFFIMAMIFVVGFYLGGKKAEINKSEDSTKPFEIENKETENAKASEETGGRAEAKKSVDFKIDFGNGEVKNFDDAEINEGENVFHLLRRISEKNGVELSYKDYGGKLGVFIEMIGGLKNNEKAGYYWQYWVNGKYATVGASFYEPQNEDKVEFRYDKSKF